MNDNSINTVYPNQPIEKTSNGLDSFYIELAIAFVYAFFIALLVDRLLGYDNVDKLCEHTGFIRSLTSPLTDPNYETKRKACEDAKKDYEKKKFTYMILIGVASIFAGVLMAKANNSYSTGGWGVALGGLFLIIWYTIMNWYSLDKTFQVAILGVAFVALFCGSMMLYSS